VGKAIPQTISGSRADCYKQQEDKSQLTTRPLNLWSLASSLTSPPFSGLGYDKIGSARFVIFFVNAGH